MRKLYNTSPGHAIEQDAIFEDGIWGEFGKNLHTTDALAIGCTLGVMLKTKDQCLVILGMDNRSSSPSLESEMSRGLAASGCYVLRAGVVPLPALLYSAHLMEASTIMISGGTQAEEINGFSIYIDHIPVRAERLRRICGLAANGHWKKNRGGALKGDIIDVYFNHLKQNTSFNQSFKIAWDLCGGTACQIVPKLSDAIKGEHLLMNEELDATFGGIPLDAYAKPRTEAMQQVVVDEKCDLGIIISADSTQIAIIDNEGILCAADTLCIILLRHICKNFDSPTIVADMATRLSVMQEIRRLGVGISFATHGCAGMIQQVIQQKATFGSDGQGRFVISADKIPASFDAIETALMVLKIMAQSAQPFSTMTLGTQHTHSIQHTFFVDPEPEATISRARTLLLKENQQPIDIDGLRFETEQGWWWMRPDKQSGKKGIALTLEAVSTAELPDLMAKVNALLPDQQNIPLPTTTAKPEKAPHQTEKAKPASSLHSISDNERENIEFISRHWSSLRKKNPEE